MSQLTKPSEVGLRDGPSPPRFPPPPPPLKAETSSKSRELNNGMNVETYCDRCWSMFSTIENLRALVSSDGYEHYNVQDMRVSAEQGCSLCDLILNNLNSMKLKSTEERMFSFRQPVQEPQETLAFVRHVFSSLKANPCKDLFCWTRNGRQPDYLHMYCTKDDPAAEYVVGRPPIMDIAVDSITRRVSDLLDDCLDKHPECPNRTRPILPTRVLDVRPSACNELIKLHVSGGDEQEEYAALSYCWGGEQYFKTTNVTLNNMISGFSLEVLPPTIRDAVLTTRKLGIHYLWVDALCIIQNDEDDKTREVANMGSIYKHAVITIAATRSDAVTKGFLDVPAQNPTCQLPFLLPNGKFGNVSLTKTIHRNSEEPLSRRGWALQEELLSPRLLSYGVKGVLWRCQSQGVKTLSNNYVRYLDLLGCLPFETHRVTQKDSTILQEQRVELWPRIIENYSRRDFTLAEDRFLALAGVISELQLIWNDLYLAGHWRRTFIEHLWWYDRLGVRVLEQAPSAKYAPSWSWTAAPGGAAVVGIKFPIAQLVEHSIIPKSSDMPFGRVKQGRILLRAKTLCNERMRKTPRRDYHMGLKLDNYEDDYASGGWVDHTSTRLTDARYLLLGKTTKKCCVGLILQPANEQDFRRIGYVLYSVEEIWLEAEWTLTSII